MNNEKEMQNRKAKKYKTGKIVLVSIVVLLSIPLTISLPDLILILRNFFSKILPISYLPMTNTDIITVDNYIIMILTICNCIVTGVLTYVTFLLSKVLGNIQINDHLAKKILWATEVERSLSSNLRCYYTLKKTAILPQLCIDTNHDQYIINLFCSHDISKSERDILTKCFVNFKRVASLINTDAHLAGIEAETIIIDYIDLVGDEFSAKDPMQQLLCKLRRIKQGDV